MKKWIALAISLMLMLSMVAVSAGAEAATPTKLEAWSFVQGHLDHFVRMSEKWNEQNPDRPIEIVPTMLEWGPMHDKLTIVLQAGEGVPDICDVEVGKWPNYMQGEIQFRSLNDFVEPLRDQLVTSRLDLYSMNGEVYGAASHIGATVMYYNTELLQAAGIDYTTLKTWDDFEAALRTYKEATGNYMTYAETYGAYVLTYMLASQGVDLIDEKGMPNLNTPEALKAVELVQKWVKEDIVGFIPGGNADTPEGKAAMAAGDFAAVGYPLWYMGRFTDEMPNLAGKVAIAPLPVFEAGQPRSVGLGGTGTVVYKNSANADLAAEFVVFAKLSTEGSTALWDNLGFDPVNVNVWADESVKTNMDNKFLKYFSTNPFDVLAEIDGEIMLAKTMQNSGTINDYLSAETFNRIYVNMEDAATVLAETQDALMKDAK